MAYLYLCIYIYGMYIDLILSMYMYKTNMGIVSCFFWGFTMMGMHIWG